MPVQLEVDSKDQSGKLNTDITAITQFRPFIDLEEEEYFVENLTLTRIKCIK